MTDDEDETVKGFISDFDLDQERDGIEVAATIKSLEITMHQVVLGNREVTTDHIHYYFMRHVRDLFQFAKTTATTSKLQMILEVLQQAETALNQEEDAEPLLRDAWHLTRRILSLEEIEKIAANQIELRRSGMEPLVFSGTDAWEQANHLLHSWSTLENEGQRVEYIVSYSDGEIDERWLRLPLYYNGFTKVPFLIGPQLHLEEQIIAVLEKRIDQASEHQASFDAAHHAALIYLRRYAVGGVNNEAVTTAILRIQKDQWSPNIQYRRSLHQEGSF